MNDIDVIKIRELNIDMIDPTTKNYTDPEQGGSKTVVIGKPGCFAFGTPVLMYDGSIKPIEAINVNDVVMGPDSLPRTVLELCRGREEMFEIIPDHGTPYTVNGKHKLVLKSKGDNPRYERNHVIEVTVNSFLTYEEEWRKNWLVYRSPVEFKTSDPYRNFDEPLLDSTEAQFMAQWDRSIPEGYRITDSRTRCEILQAMLDVNGFYDSVERAWFINSTTKRFIEQIVFLARSLGYSANVNPCQKSNTVFFQTIIRGNGLPEIKYETDPDSQFLSSSFRIEPRGQGDYYGFVIGGDHRFLLGSFDVVRNTGKCLAPGTKILMYDGSIRKVENVTVGDLLMGDDSTPRKVLSTCHGVDDMYEIVQKNGENYTVNKPHILSLIDARGDKVDIPLETLLTNNNGLENFRGYKTSVQFEERKTRKDPYYFGYNLIAGETLSDPINGNKYIPDEYKINSTSVRLEVLAGLIEANAWFNSELHLYNFYHQSERLIEDVVYIARSLGFKADVIDIYNCVISGPVEDIPCRLMPKRPVPRSNTHLQTELSYIPKGTGEYYGFELDGNKRFVLGDFTVTHNTTLIASLLYAKKHIFPVGIAMSGTEDSNHFFRNIMPSTFVFNTYDEEQLEKFIKRQKLAKQHLKNPWGVVILDDCTDDPALFRKPLQNGMYKRGRHWKMWYILSLQYGMDVRPVVRTNVDGTFILREPNMRNRRVMYENYASIIPDFKIFCDILDQITNDYTALYIHNQTTSNKWQDCIFWYKAKKVPADFRFGCDDYWDFHYARYNSEYIDPVTV